MEGISKSPSLVASTSDLYCCSIAESRVREGNLKDDQSLEQDTTAPKLLKDEDLEANYFKSVQWCDSTPSTIIPSNFPPGPRMEHPFSHQAQTIQFELSFSHQHSSNHPPPLPSLPTQYTRTPPQSTASPPTQISPSPTQPQPSTSPPPLTSQFASQTPYPPHPLPYPAIPSYHQQQRNTIPPPPSSGPHQPIFLLEQTASSPSSTYRAMVKALFHECLPSPQNAIK